jgi:hypothetical protein
LFLFVYLFVYNKPPEQFFSYPADVTITGDRDAKEQAHEGSKSAQ